MKGQVKTNLGIQNVEYKFINENEINCIDLDDDSKFTTHYKSLIV